MAFICYLLWSLLVLVLPLAFFLPAEGSIYQAICSRDSTDRLFILVIFIQATGMLN